VISGCEEQILKNVDILH